jgi:ORF6N domain
MGKHEVAEPMASEKAATLEIDRLENFIYEIRGQKVMLDAGLASVYGVTTARLNQQVKRNQERFPGDFVFQLTSVEYQSLMLQNCNIKNRPSRTSKASLCIH